VYLWTRFGPAGLRVRVRFVIKRHH
jgi:hypothetical protein